MNRRRFVRFGPGPVCCLSRDGPAIRPQGHRRGRVKISQHVLPVAGRGFARERVLRDEGRASSVEESPQPMPTQQALERVEGLEVLQRQRVQVQGQSLAQVPVLRLLPMQEPGVPWSEGWRPHRSHSILEGCVHRWRGLRRHRRPSAHRIAKTWPAPPWSGRFRPCAAIERHLAHDHDRAHLQTKMRPPQDQA